jgi:allophanate hydrolase subunit 2
LGALLHAGQEIVCGVPADSDWALPMEQIPRYGAAVTLRVVAGYQESEFSAGALGMFYGSTFQVSPRSDRMGYRLEGNAVAAPAGERLSEGIAYGAVQVPPDGQPIVLLNDRQTIGGYPKLGTVLSPDCWKLAQCVPGATVRFEVISLESAQALVEEAKRARDTTVLKRGA